MKPWEEYLTSIYYDPKHPGSYAGPKKLYEAVKASGKFKIGTRRIKQWLKSQETYTMTRHARRKFPRNTYEVPGIDNHWQSDLMDMIKLSSYNDGVKYLMIIIDLFSRYLWILPLKSKTSKEVTDVLNHFWLKEKRSPQLFQSDSGTEYKNRTLKSLLKSKNIHQLFSLNETKSPYAERVIKTIKMKLYRYMLKNFTNRYIDVLDDTVKSYNNTKHRMLGQTPISVNKNNETEVRLSQYLIKKPMIKVSTKRKFTFKVHDKVRVSHLKQTFDREYEEKWSGEIFTIERRYWSQKRDLYKLNDWSGEPIEGTFYSVELQKVVEDPDQEYRIQDIVKKELVKRKRKLWLNGYIGLKSTIHGFLRKI
jgi:transposase InsO family protein